MRGVKLGWSDIFICSRDIKNERHVYEYAYVERQMFVIIYGFEL